MIRATSGHGQDPRVPSRVLSAALQCALGGKWVFRGTLFFAAHVYLVLDKKHSSVLEKSWVLYEQHCEQTHDATGDSEKKTGDSEQNTGVNRQGSFENVSKEPDPEK